MGREPAITSGPSELLLLLSFLERHTLSQILPSHGLKAEQGNKGRSEGELEATDLPSGRGPCRNVLGISPWIN